MNAREGFRFSAPEGWSQRARGEAPPGKLQGERVLAEYKCLHCDKPAVLEVTVGDVPASTPLGKYVKEHNFTGQQWRPKGPAETRGTRSARPSIPSCGDAPSRGIIASPGREGKTPSCPAGKLPRSR